MSGELGLLASSVEPPPGACLRSLPDARRTLHRPRKRFHRGIYLRVMKRKAPVPTVVF
jgi:hypothetical protein